MPTSCALQMVYIGAMTVHASRKAESDFGSVHVACHGILLVFVSVTLLGQSPDDDVCFVPINMCVHKNSAIPIALLSRFRRPRELNGVIPLHKNYYESINF